MSTAARMVSANLSSQFLSEFCSDVVVGLSHQGQKELPSKYLYDEVGSALFDVICVLPEYGLSRAGMRMLQNYAGEIVDHVPSPVVVAELGSGSGQKTRWLLEALARRQILHLGQDRIAVGVGRRPQARAVVRAGHRRAH